jgi:hypothetical protein
MAKKKESLFSPAQRNVVATFRNLKEARKAMDALESHGFEAGAIRLEGPGVAPSGKADTRRRDAGVSRLVGSRTAAGLIVGGILGLGIGLVVGALAAGSATSLAVGGAAGCIVGGAIGFMVAGVSSIDVTPDWERTFEKDRSGPVTVSAGSDDPIKVAQAQEALRDLDPVNVTRVDERGEPL